MRYVSGPDNAGARQGGCGPPWDLVVDIVLDARRTGSYLAGVQDLDRLPDLRAAAGQAARVLGAHARLELSAPAEAVGRSAVVRVSFVGERGALRRAHAGLATMLDAVRRRQRTRSDPRP